MSNPEILKVVIVTASLISSFIFTERAEFPHFVHGRHELERPSQHILKCIIITQLGYVSAVLMFS